MSFGSYGIHLFRSGWKSIKEPVHVIQRERKEVREEEKDRVLWLSKIKRIIVTGLLRVYGFNVV